MVVHELPGASFLKCMEFPKRIAYLRRSGMKSVEFLLVEKEYPNIFLLDIWYIALTVGHWWLRRI